MFQRIDELRDKDTPASELTYRMFPSLNTLHSGDEDYEKSNAWMNAVVETDSGDSIDEWSDDELGEEYVAEDG